MTGIDLGEKALGVAKLHRLESGVAVDYRLIAAEALAAESPGSVRRRHLHGNARACAGPGGDRRRPARRCAAPGGTVVFSTLNRNPKSYLFAILGAEYLLQLLPRGTHDWAKFLRPAELATFARRAGTRPHRPDRHDLQPVHKVFRLEPDTSVNYLAAYRKPAARADHAG